MQLLCNQHSDLFPFFRNFTLHSKDNKRPRESKQNGHIKRSLYSQCKEKHKPTKNQKELQTCESLLKAKNLPWGKKPHKITPLPNKAGQILYETAKDAVFKRNMCVCVCFQNKNTV